MTDETGEAPEPIATSEEEFELLANSVRIEEGSILQPSAVPLFAPEEDQVLDESLFITSIAVAKKPRLSPFWSRVVSWLIILMALLLVAAIAFGFVFVRTDLIHR